jgi:protein dithiol:quinone oxidoreductase
MARRQLRPRPESQPIQAPMISIMPPSIPAPPTIASRKASGWLLGTVALSGVAAVGLALALQHLLGMPPCPWCVLQRAIFLTVSLICVLALPWPGRAARVLAAGLAVPLALAGMAAALWQHFVAAASDSCSVSLADRIVVGLHLDTLWPDLFLAGTGCADATANLLGIPFPFWSLALFALIGAACALTLRRTLTDG